jgi:hypothetical protein
VVSTLEPVYKVKTRFQAFASFTCSLYRYAPARDLSREWISCASYINTSWTVETTFDSTRDYSWYNNFTGVVDPRPAAGELPPGALAQQKDNTWIVVGADKVGLCTLNEVDP